MNEITNKELLEMTKDITIAMLNSGYLCPKTANSAGNKSPISFTKSFMDGVYQKLKSLSEEQ